MSRLIIIALLLGLPLSRGHGSVSFPQPRQAIDASTLRSVQPAGVPTVRRDNYGFI